MSKTIRAKMQVQSVTTDTYSERPVLTAVYGGSTNAEDNTYAKATPSGELKLQIDNDGAKGILKPGVKVYVEITGDRGAAAHGVSSSIPNEPWLGLTPADPAMGSRGFSFFAIAEFRCREQEVFR